VPWKLRREVYLILLGVVVLVLSIIVLARHRSVDTDLLAVVGLVGGVAIVIVSLPGNGS
jgi:predicted neutral ceramidase superfamily lipid hydrolase